MQQFHTISHIEMAVYKTGTGTLGRVYEDLGLGDAREGTLGHQVWDVGTCRTREVKSEVNAISLSS